MVACRRISRRIALVTWRTWPVIQTLNRSDSCGRLPSLRGRAPPPRHILGDAGLADLDAELEKLSMDSRRSPQPVGDAHLADQPANFQRCSWSATAVPRFPAPIRS